MAFTLSKSKNLFIKISPQGTETEDADLLKNVLSTNCTQNCVYKQTRLSDFQSNVYFSVCFLLWSRESRIIFEAKQF